MIEINLYKTKLCIDFTFFAAIALFFYLDESGFGIMSVCACIIHESGHLSALFFEKRDFTSLTLYGGGIKIGYKKDIDASFFLILAGSLFNMLFFVFFYFVFPLNFTFKVFAVINLIIGIFNLLPLRFFDGGRLFEKIIIKLLPAEKALNLSRKTEKITAFLTILTPFFIMLFGGFNMSVMFVMIYVIICDIITKKKANFK